MLIDELLAEAEAMDLATLGERVAQLGQVYSRRASMLNGRAATAVDVGAVAAELAADVSEEKKFPR